MHLPWNDKAELNLYLEKLGLVSVETELMLNFYMV